MTSLIESLQTLFERDLKRLKKEIELFDNENTLWIAEKDFTNSTGNLCLHLFGNLQHYIGALLGGSSYIREREKEFSAKNIPRSKLLTELETTQIIVWKTLENLTEVDLDKVYPEQVFGYEMKTVFFLIHLSGHFNYHLGQINYQRRKKIY